MDALLGVASMEQQGGVPGKSSDANNSSEHLATHPEDDIVGKSEDQLKQDEFQPMHKMKASIIPPGHISGPSRRSSRKKKPSHRRMSDSFVSVVNDGPEDLSSKRNRRPSSKLEHHVQGRGSSSGRARAASAAGPRGSNKVKSAVRGQSPEQVFQDVTVSSSPPWAFADASHETLWSETFSISDLAARRGAPKCVHMTVQVVMASGDPLDMTFGVKVFSEKSFRNDKKGYVRGRFGQAATASGEFSLLLSEGEGSSKDYVMVNTDIVSLKHPLFAVAASKEYCMKLLHRTSGSKTKPKKAQLTSVVKRGEILVNGLSQQAAMAPSMSRRERGRARQQQQRENAVQAAALDRDNRSGGLETLALALDKALALAAAQEREKLERGEWGEEQQFQSPEELSPESLHLGARPAQVHFVGSAPTSTYYSSGQPQNFLQWQQRQREQQWAHHQQQQQQFQQQQQQPQQQQQQQQHPVVTGFSVGQATPAQAIVKQESHLQNTPYQFGSAFGSATAPGSQTSSTRRVSMPYAIGNQSSFPASLSAGTSPGQNVQQPFILQSAASLPFAAPQSAAVNISNSATLGSMPMSANPGQLPSQFFVPSGGSGFSSFSAPDKGASFVPNFSPSAGVVNLGNMPSRTTPSSPQLRARPSTKDHAFSIMRMAASPESSRKRSSTADFDADVACPNSASKRRRSFMHSVGSAKQSSSLTSAGSPHTGGGMSALLAASAQGSRVVQPAQRQTGFILPSGNAVAENGNSQEAGKGA